MNQHAAHVAAPPNQSAWTAVTRALIVAGLAGTLAAAVYLNGLSNPFVFDDRTEIVENSSIRRLGDLPAILSHSITRPVTNLSHALEFAVWGENPFGYHLTNLLLHVANVLLLFALAYRLSADFEVRAGRRLPGLTGPFAAAALFAVHPLLTEAVVYVSGRAEVLCGTFALAALLAVRKALGADGRVRVGGALLAVAFTVLAIATKELGVMLPAAFLAYDVLLLPRATRAGRVRRVHAPLLLSIAAVGVWRVWLYVGLQHPDAAGFDWRNGLVELHVIARYLGLLVFPASLSVAPAVNPIHSLLDERVLVAVPVVGGVLAAAALLRKREPIVSFGLIWFFLLLIPSAALILLASKGQPMAEHRVYVASCGFFLACGRLLAIWIEAEPASSRKRWTAASAGLAVMLAVLSGLTVARNQVWSDPVRLFEDAARKAPRVWAAQYGAADARLAAEDFEEAIPAYRKAIALRPGHAFSYLGLARAHIELGEVAEARDVLRTGSVRVPSDPRLKLVLADLEERVFQRPAEALQLCREVLKRTPGSGEAAACVKRNEAASVPR